MWPTKRFFIVLLATLTSYLASLYLSSSLWYLFTLLCLSLIFSFISFLYQIKQFSWFFDDKTCVLERGNYFDYEIILNNATIFSIHSVELVIIQSRQDFNFSKEEYLLQLKSRERRCINNRLNCRHRGIYYTSLKSITMYDCFAYFKRVWHGTQQKIIVLPKKLDLEASQRKLSNDSLLSQHFASNSKTEQGHVNSIKLYRDGESLKNCLIKKYAASRVLWSQEFNDDVPASSLIVLDLSCAHKSEQALYAQDRLFEALIAEMQNSLSQGIPVQVFCHKQGSILQFSLASQSGLDSFIYDSLSIQFGDEAALEDWLPYSQVFSHVVTSGQQELIIASTRWDEGLYNFIQKYLNENQKISAQSLVSLLISPIERSGARYNHLVELAANNPQSIKVLSSESHDDV